jgi:hypothetical protein
MSSPQLGLYKPSPVPPGVECADAVVWKLYDVKGREVTAKEVLASMAEAHGVAKFEGMDDRPATRPATNLVLVSPHGLITGGDMSQVVWCRDVNAAHPRQGNCRRAA